jgi:hypothetical protein
MNGVHAARAKLCRPTGIVGRENVAKGVIERRGAGASEQILLLTLLQYYERLVLNQRASFLE